MAEITLDGIVEHELNRLILEGLIAPEHREDAKNTMLRELRRRTRCMVTDIARKASIGFLLSRIEGLK